MLTNEVPTDGDTSVREIATIIMDALREAGQTVLCSTSVVNTRVYMGIETDDGATVVVEVERFAR